jgi:hypothetical protein
MPVQDKKDVEEKSELNSDSTLNGAGSRLCEHRELQKTTQSNKSGNASSNGCSLTEEIFGMIPSHFDDSE